MLKKLLRGVLLGIIGCAALVFALALLSWAFGPGLPPEEGRAASVARRADISAAPDATKARAGRVSVAGGPEIRVGGTYVTFDAGYVSAPRIEVLRQAIGIVGESGRVIAPSLDWSGIEKMEADQAALAKLGVGRIASRFKVIVVAEADGGRFVQVEEPKSGKKVWTVAEGLAMPVFDHDSKAIAISEGYIVKGPDTVAATSSAPVVPALDAVVAALPERDALGDPRPDSAWDEALAQVVAETPGLVILPAASRVTVVDFDIDNSIVVKVRVEGETRELWTNARSLSRRVERLPATTR